jgi:NADH dehydrogenase/NADH:ubiquinone oxidoreductase subunit G
LFAIRRNLVEGAEIDVVVPISEGETRSIKNGRGIWIESADAHPNSTGARHLGLTTVDSATLESSIRGGSGPILILDGDAHPWLASEDAVALQDRKVAILARNRTPLVDVATMVLPLASWVETEGTYTSSTGRVQLARRAFSPRGQARPPWEVVYRLAVELGIEQERGISPRVLFAEMAAEVAAFSGMTWGRLAAETGMRVHEEMHRVG